MLLKKYVFMIQQNEKLKENKTNEEEAGVLSLFSGTQTWMI